MKRINYLLIHSLIFTALIFILITFFISIYFDIYPFGNKTLLTIDLSQQYYDFLAFYRDTLLKNPSQFLYSFKKGIGGETIGLWSYYLMSPYNLIVLLLPKEKLLLSVHLIIYLKFLSALFSSCLYFYRHNQSRLHIVALSLSYLMMSALILNYFNIMWLDGFILLPLITLGIDKIFDQKGNKTYSLFLGLAIISNFYIGWMLSIFSLLYFLSKLFSQKTSVFKNVFLTFMTGSLKAGLLASFLLFPLVDSLAQSKGLVISASEHLKDLPQVMTIVAKWLNGAFVFNDIKRGAPPVYIGSLPLILNLYYFFSVSVTFREKLQMLFLQGIMIISFLYWPFNLVWHGGQEPIWYPYRYTFIFSFIQIIIFSQSFKHILKNLEPHALILSSTSILMTYLFIYDSIESYVFLRPLNVQISALLIIINTIVLLRKHNIAFKKVALLIVLVFDLTMNATKLLENFHFVSIQAIEKRDRNTFGLQDDKSSFYRIHFQGDQTKNTALNSQYYGANHFSSTLEKSAENLFGYLGLIESAASISYNHRSIITDDFFSMKFLIENRQNSTSNQEPLICPNEDWDLYTLHRDNQHSILYENHDYLDIANVVSDQITDPQVTFHKHDPVYNQSLLVSLLNPLLEETNFFEELPLNFKFMEEMLISNKEAGEYVTYQALNYQISKEYQGKIHFSFFPKKEPLLYLSIPSQLDPTLASLAINGVDFDYQPNFRQRQLVSLPFDSDQENRLTVMVKNDQLKINPIKLYHFNYDQYLDYLNQLETPKAKTSLMSSNVLVTDIQTKKEETILYMIPYDKNWQATIDKKEVPIYPVLNDTLIAIKVPEGKHQIELRYLPKSLIYGTILSSLTLIGIIINSLKKFFSRKGW